MRSWLTTLLRNLFGDSVARVLGGAGISVVTGAVLMPLVITALNAASSAVAGIGGDILQVMLLAGVGECMSIIGSAMLTRMALNSTRLGLKKAVQK